MKAEEDIVVTVVFNRTTRTGCAARMETRPGLPRIYGSVPARRSFGDRSNFTRGRSRSSGSSKRGRTSQINYYGVCWHCLVLSRMLSVLLIVTLRDLRLIIITVETLNMVQNDFYTVENFDSVKTGNLIEQDILTYMCVATHVLLFFFSRASQKERSKLPSGKDQNKTCKACFFLKSTCVLFLL